MPEPSAVDPTEFRRSISAWATGVSVVTTRDGAAVAGLTVNALLSVSLAPPTLLVSLTNDADTTPRIRRGGRFAVSVLRADQRAVSERFALAVPSAEKFQGIAVHDSPGGQPWVDGALANFECVVDHVVPAGDHTLFLGRVVAIENGADGLPLTFFRSRYGRAVGNGAVDLSGTRP